MFVYSGDIDVALQLLKAGALLEIENDEEGNAVHVVRDVLCRLGGLAFSESLHVKRCRPDTSVQAAAYGFVSFCQRLVLETGFGLDGKNHHGASLLHIACMQGRYPVVAWLLREGASVLATDKFGRSVEVVSRLSGLLFLGERVLDFVFRAVCVCVCVCVFMHV